MLRGMKVVIVCMCLGFIGVACDREPHDPVLVEVEALDVEESYLLTEFDIERIRLVLTYDDGRQEEIGIDETMLSESDLEKLTHSGTHELLVHYASFDIPITVTLLSEKSYLSMQVFEMGKNAGLIEEETYEDWLESIRGEDGRDIEIRVDDDLLQWRYAGEAVWIDLFDFSALAEDEWDHDIHTVEFLDDSDEPWSTVYVLGGTTVPLPKAPPKIGYDFIGWDTCLAEVSENIIVRPLYDIGWRTLTLKTGDGSPDAIVQEAFTPLELPVPERSGYHFDGWYEDTVYETPFTADTMPTEDMDVYASWVKRLDVVELADIKFQGRNHARTGTVTLDGILVATIEHHRSSGVDRFAFSIDAPFAELDFEETFVMRALDDLHTMSWCEDFNCFDRSVIDDTLYYDYLETSRMNLLTADIETYWFEREGATYVLLDAYKPLVVEALWDDAQDAALSSYVITMIEDGFMVAATLEDAQGTWNYEMVVDQVGLTDFDEDFTVVCEYTMSGWDYDIIDDGVVITGYTGTSVDIVVPPTFEGLPVVAIGPDVFYYEETSLELKSIILPDTVVLINDRAFMTPTLESVVFGADSQLDIIGNLAFSTTTELETFDFPSGVRIIGKSAFALSALTELDLPEGLESIGAGAFSYVSHIERVVIPDSVETIGAGAFAQYSPFDVLSPEIGRLSEVVFGEDSALKSLGEKVFMFANLTTLVLPEGLETIDTKAFAYMWALRFIHIPESVETMGADVFFETNNVLITTAAPALPPMWDPDWNKADHSVIWKLPSFTGTGVSTLFEDLDNYGYERTFEHILAPFEHMEHFYYGRDGDEHHHTLNIFDVNEGVWHTQEEMYYYPENDGHLRYAWCETEACYDVAYIDEGDMPDFNDLYHIAHVLVAFENIDWFVYHGGYFQLKEEHIDAVSHLLGTPSEESLLSYAFRLGYDGGPTIEIVWTTFSDIEYELEIYHTITYSHVGATTVPAPPTDVCDELGLDMVVVGEAQSYEVPSGYHDNDTVIVVGGYHIAQHLTTYELWYEVRVWAEANGYAFRNPGREGSEGIDGAAPTAAKLEPVTMVSWADVIVWLNAFSEMEGLEPVYRDVSDFVMKDAWGDIWSVVQTERDGYRLPTSDEWEMAARWKDDTESTDGSIFVGERYWTPGNYASGATDDNTHEEATRAVAWYSFGSESPDNHTRPVAQLLPNHLGVYDMSGNAWEWTYTLSGSNRVIRGGSYRHSATTISVGYETSDDLSNVNDSVGFRIVRNP